MVKIKPLEAISKNYEGAIGEAERRYKEEVARSSGWNAAAVASQDRWVAAVSSSEAQDRRVKNLQKVSDEEWRQKALSKGAARIGSGMRSAVGDQRSGFAPYHAALASASLSERSSDPMANIKRVEEVMKVMLEKKKEIG